MIPYIQKGDLTALHGKRRKAICGCETQCKTFYTFTTDDEKTDFMLCAGDARQFGFELLEMLGAVKSGLLFNGPNLAWSGEDERLIQKYFKENDCIDENGKVRYGINAALAGILGRNRSQVKQKVQRMRNEGKLLV